MEVPIPESASADANSPAASELPSTEAAAAKPDGAAKDTNAPADHWLNAVPSHARGLLKIRVPVQVTLATQRKSIQEIIELGPGSIVKFDRTCDEPLELTVGERTIARGEVVKVGDKFGLRIGSLVPN